KAKRDHPRARKRTKVFACSPDSQTDVAVLVIDGNLDFGRWNNSPPWVATLRSDETRSLRNGIEHPHRRRGSEISRKKAKMKTGATFRCLGQSLPQLPFVRATPIKTMMQQR